MYKPKCYIEEPSKFYAIKWKGNNVLDVDRFVYGYPKLDTYDELTRWLYRHYVIEQDGNRYPLTVEGEKVYVSVGDYIVKNEAGNYFPCHHEEFKSKYARYKKGEK